IEKVKTNPKYYKLFVLQNPSAYLYPLTIRLASMNMLDRIVDADRELTFLDLLEICDVRVYKTYGGTAAKDITDLARIALILNANEISLRLYNFCKYYADDSRFYDLLVNWDVYKHNESLKRIFIELCEVTDKKNYDASTLVRFNLSNPQIEHVFSQDPTSGFPSSGFLDLEMYNQTVHKLGNLTILEKRINRLCSNSTVHQKVSDPTLYPSSMFSLSTGLAASIQSAGGLFTKSDVEERSKIIANFAILRWPLWM
ncbi:MAG: HNH endonuclease family protein, partial [bacterium]